MKKLPMKKIPTVILLLIVLALVVRDKQELRVANAEIIELESQVQGLTKTLDEKISAIDELSSELEENKLKLGQ